MKLGERKTHCKWGHEYTSENTIVREKGRQRCRTCTELKRHRPENKVKKSNYDHGRIEANRSKKREYDKSYNMQNRERKNAYALQWWKDHPERVRAGWLWRTFKLTPEQWESKFDAQGRCCVLCGTKAPGKKGWHTDHDHACCSGTKSCGKCVRDILCGLCNNGLGHFKDDMMVLRKAVDYLEHHRKELACRISTTG